jgi:phasin family protein
MTKDTYSFTEMLRKAALDLGLPKLDIDKLVEAQRKNLDALGQATQAAVGGAESLIGKQREALEAGLRAASDLARNYKPSGSPAEVLAKQTEFTKKAFDVTIQNARDVADITKKSTSDVAQIIRDRLEANLAEIKASVESSVASGAEKTKKA